MAAEEGFPGPGVPRRIARLCGPPVALGSGNWLLARRVSSARLIVEPR